MRWMMRAAGWLALAGTLGLAACGGGDSDDNGAGHLRLLNASTGYASLDLYVDDSVKNSAVTYGTQGAYVDVGTSDSLSTVITSTGSTTALSSSSRSFVKDVSYTLVAYGWQGALKTALIEESTSAADSGKSALTVLNLASDAGTVDVYVTGSDESLDDATAIASGVAGGSSVSSISLGVGTFRLRVTGTGDKSDLRLDVQGLTLASTQVATLILTPGTGGVLVNGLLAVQKGSVTALSNSKARARVVAAVSGNGKVTAQINGSTLASSATSPSIGSYALIDGSATAPVVLAVNGTVVSVASQAMPAGGDYTLLVWGDAAAPQITLITDDNRLPSVTSNAKLRLVHGVAGLAVPLTLTADFSAVASNVSQGQASAWANVAASSTMRIEVSSPLSTTPLYSLTDASILAKGLYTVFMLGDSVTPQAVLRKDR
ncbi:DUF4397 domain-containing protein [Aquabacterium sp. OR-4]|uniref:DUF4397 domain-containing protein n=1 Tax=Aquabacterium sp. OR-4 TaxID=2978127 RepID=UPI0021B43B83|nr:DUF4397 domain-containing protein [Aquabacterium sp. OR-4]MDT7833888.1 DUF4397 domain-containing protein [Aquabacterium sp. OR-4]